MPEHARNWFGLLGGALAWTVHLMGAYALAEGFCRSGLAASTFGGFSILLWGLSLLTVLALGVAGYAFWIARGLTTVFLAQTGGLANLLFLLIILAQSLPFILPGRDC